MCVQWNGFKCIFSMRHSNSWLSCNDMNMRRQWNLCIKAYQLLYRSITWTIIPHWYELYKRCESATWIRNSPNKFFISRAPYARIPFGSDIFSISNAAMKPCNICCFWSNIRHTKFTILTISLKSFCRKSVLQTG